ncbi:MAG: S8 family serine peptidase [Bacteroidales bacterium]|nr:S8 family serine peptidase [Bacteroidales bacterium]
MNKYLYIILTASLLACVSCVKEDDVFEVERDLAPQEQVFGSSLSDEDLLSSMNIYVSDDLAAKLEESTKSNGEVNLRPFKSLTQQGVVKMRRLFPHAGKFEERTRAEGLHKWYILSYEEGHSMTKASDGLLIEGVELIEYCPKIAIVGNPEVVEVVSAATKASSSGVFDDPMLDQQWHYYNNGKASSSVSGCDINVVPVWRNYSTYNKYKGDIIVGIVDGGIDYKHEDLAENMWKNPDKTGENVYGYNFVSNSFVVTPDDHGTHVAGTIAAVNNNGIGVAGIAGGDKKKRIPGVKLMSCQIFEGKNSGPGAEAIKWSADNGAVISQNSWGYPTLDATPSSVKSAVDYFEKYAGVDENGRQVGPMKGGLVIFAAGNEAKNTSSSDYEKILSVTSVGADYKRAYYTCYGSWADIIAPGGDAKKGNQVLSTIPGNKYGKMQGTSMACPHVSGVAALALARHGGDGYTPAALRKQLEDNVTDISSFNTGYELGKGLVNAYKTMGASGGKAPDVPTGLSATAQSNNISFTVNVPRDADDGVPSSIYIYYSTSDFTSTKNKSFGMFYVEDLKAGDVLSGTISGVEFETKYYLAAVAGDLAANKSSLSSRITVTTGPNSAPVLNTSSDLEIKIRPHEKTSADFDIVEPDGHFYLIDLEPGSEAAVLDTLVRNSPRIRLTPSLVPTGSYTAVLTVTDIYGLATTATYKYEVLPNHKPVVAKPFDNLIFNSKAAEVKELIATEFFSDEDGEELAYSFEFSQPDVANMTYSGGKFQITSMNYGVSDITVTGTDIRGETVSQALKVLVRSDSKALSLYPNPVLDKMNIRVGSDVAQLALKMISATGSTAFEAEYTNVSPFAPAVADLSALVPGSYTAVVVMDGVEYKQQIVKL